VARRRRRLGGDKPANGAAAAAANATTTAAPTTAGGRARWIAAALLLALAVVAGAWFTTAGIPPPVPGAAPVVAPGAAPAGTSAASPAAGSPAATYVANAQCLSCHPAQAAAWQASHHALAMALPTAQTVRGDFDDATFTHQGIRTRFFRRGDKYLVHTEGADGKFADFEVKYSFGVEPLQQYLIETEGGRLQPLTIAWNTRDRKWFHLLPNEKTPPGDVLHWTGRYQTGNTMCISCHTTGFEKRFDAGADRFDSRWAEPNVSCQACHGPGSRHFDWARRKTEGQATLAYEPGARLADLRSPKAQVDACAACHSRRAELSATAVPGEPHLDHFLPALLRQGLYHADGQQLDEVYVVGSFRQSKMFRAGVACSDCHDPHSAKPRLQGNALCLQCHATPANPAFAAAAGSFDSPAHHHHAPGSAGAQCTACHMPVKNYMVVQPRPDHSLRIPRPDLTVAIGTPNACNQCHAKRSAQWAADAVSRWFGAKPRPSHFGTVFAAARRGEAGAGLALAALAADTQQAPIVRATALEQLRTLGATGIDVRVDATHDDDGEVRAAAAAGLDELPAAQRVPALAPLLKDPLRAVRIAAARSLSSLPAEQFDAPTRSAYDAALTEYIAAQRATLDMPGSNLNLAVVYANTGRDDLAERHYLAALKIDPDFMPARANLAQFYSARARNADAERVLQEGLQRQPELGELQYSLGLLLAEEQRLDEAATALASAARLLPQRARVHYNLGLALQQLGKAQPAEAALLQARRADPADPAIAYALAVFYAQQGRRPEALRAAEALQQLRPGDPQVAQLLQRLRGQAQ
jgi:predicted CXXCH cytochrome family protein